MRGPDGLADSDHDNCATYCTLGTYQPSSPSHCRHRPRLQGAPQGYLRRCGLPTCGVVDGLPTRAQSSELAKKVIPARRAGGRGAWVLIPKRLLPGRERAPGRRFPGKPPLGSPEPSPPNLVLPPAPAATLGARQPGAWEGTARHWLQRGTERRDQRGPPDSGKPQPRGCRSQSSPALPCPARRGGVM